jgi:hypothetical protein
MGNLRALMVTITIFVIDSLQLTYWCIHWFIQTYVGVVLEFEEKEKKGGARRIGVKDNRSLKCLVVPAKLVL